MEVREILLDILEEVISALTTGNAVGWADVFIRLEHAHDEAVAQMAFNDGLPASMVSALNLLTDCVKDVVQAHRVRGALPNLDVGPGWDIWLTGSLRHGPEVRLEDEEKTTGYSAMKWDKFVEFHGAKLGYAPDSKHAVEEHWEKVEKGEERLPLADLHLAGSVNSSWFTSDGENGQKLKTEAYDALGLDWTPRDHSVRAILLGCPIRVRKLAAHSLHCPTAADGWNNLFYVPHDASDHTWPNHGSMTSTPAGANGYPEAIHGPATASTEMLDIISLGTISVGNRPMQYGVYVMRRAIDRLLKAVFG